MPSEKNLRRRRALIAAGTVPLQVMPFEPKMVANSTCVFCPAQFGDRYYCVCPACRCCQYCGLVVKHHQYCPFCGNKPEHDMVRPVGIRKRATHGPRKRPQKQNRSVRRVGPMTRDLRHGGVL